MDIDIVVETRKKVLQTPQSYIAIEVKFTKKWEREWSLPLMTVMADAKTRIASSYGVYLGEKIIEDGALTILPFAEFSRRLWNGEIF